MVPNLLYQHFLWRVIFVFLANLFLKPFWLNWFYLESTLLRVLWFLWCRCDIVTTFSIFLSFLQIPSFFYEIFLKYIQNFDSHLWKTVLTIIYLFFTFVIHLLKKKSYNITSSRFFFINQQINTDIYNIFFFFSKLITDEASLAPLVFEILIQLK